MTKPANTAARGFSRRTFLMMTAAAAGTGAAAASLTACGAQPTVVSTEDGTSSSAHSWETAPEPIAESDITATETADVVVIGAGISGISTAVSSLENGLSVIVLEKNQYPRYTGLDFGCVNPSINKEYGIEDIDPYTVVRDWVRTSTPRVRADHLMQYALNSGKAMDWACEKAESWGARPCVSAQFSNSDAYPNLGTAIEFHDGPAWDPATESLGSRDLIDSMTDQFVKGGGTLSYETRAMQLVKDGDTVTGVVAERADGSYARYDATKGVVLACGDFAGDPEMLAAWQPFDVDSFNPDFFLNCSTGTGDGHKMGLWAGAAMQQGPQPIMWLPFTTLTSIYTSTTWASAS